MVLQLDFWKAPHKPNLPVDIHVTDEAYKMLAGTLKEQNIQFQIVIMDVEKMMKEERRGVQSRSLYGGFQYSIYHPLNEVVRVLIDLVVLIRCKFKGSNSAQ